MTDILYKYKSLDNFKNFVDIILKKRLYSAKYKDLNDPMEGQYYYRRGELDRDLRNKLMEEKGELRICSLSRINDNELMWSHYSNGQRGVVIGVRIDETKYIIRPIQYSGLALIQNSNYNDQTAIDTLSHKNEVWNYEQEERAFVHRKNFIDVEVVEVITGRSMSKQDLGFIRSVIKKIDSGIRIIKADTIM